MILDALPHITASKITTRTQGKINESSKTQNHQRESKNKNILIFRNLAWIDLRLILVYSHSNLKDKESTHEHTINLTL